MEDMLNAELSPIEALLLGLFLANCRLCSAAVLGSCSFPIYTEVSKVVEPLVRAALGQGDHFCQGISAPCALKYGVMNIYFSFFFSI